MYHTSKALNLVAVGLVVLLLVAAGWIFVGGALAEETAAEPAAVEAFSWEYLATTAGCAVAVLLIVQGTKKLLDNLIKIPTAVYAYIIAVLILVLAMIFTQGFTWSAFALCFLNGWIAASTASHTYDIAAHKLN